MDELAVATILGAVIGACVSGAIVGAVPAVCGAVKGKIGLGIGGFFACVVSSFVLGLFLSIPCCALFLFLIFKKDNKNAVLINCKNCGKNISAEQSFCPHCGNPKE